MIGTIPDPRTCTEKELLERTVNVAREFGWRAVHFGGNLHKRAWHDAAGFPDLLMVHPERGVILFVELKSADGRLTDRQERWAALLTHEKLNYHLWRPEHWPDIVQVLSHGTAVAT